MVALTKIAQMVHGKMMFWKHWSSLSISFMNEKTEAQKIKGHSRFHAEFTGKLGLKTGLLRREDWETGHYTVHLEHLCLARWPGHPAYGPWMKWATFTLAQWPSLCVTWQVRASLSLSIKWAPNSGYYLSAKWSTTDKHTSWNSTRFQNIRCRRYKPVTYGYFSHSPNINILVAEKQYEFSHWLYPILGKKEIIKQSLQTFIFSWIDPHPYRIVQPWSKRHYICTEL